MSPFAFRNHKHRWFAVSIHWIILLLSVLAVPACGKKSSESPPNQPINPDQVLATIGDEKFRQAAFETFLRERFPEAPSPPPHNDAVLSDLFDQAINERLLLQAARENHMTVPEEEVQQWLSNSALTQNLDLSKMTEEERSSRLERAREILIVSQYLQQLGPPPTRISSTQEREYFNSHPEEFQEPEQYHVFEILVKDEPLAREMERRLSRRESFESLARKYSRNPVASKGGDLGWFAQGELPEQFEKVVMRLKPGAHSQILPTDYGFHIFKLKEIRKGRTLPLEKGRPQIQGILLARQRKETIDQEIARLRKAIPVRIEADHLGFKYVARR